MDRPTCRTCVVWVPSLSRIFHSCWSVVASSRMRHGTRAGYHRRTLYHALPKPTYLSRDVFAPLEIGILTYTNHGGHLARLPVNKFTEFLPQFTRCCVLYFVIGRIKILFRSTWNFFFIHRPTWETGACFTCTEYTLHILSNHSPSNRHFQLFYLTNEMFISNN